MIADFQEYSHPTWRQRALRLLPIAALWVIPLSTLCMAIALHHSIPWGDDISLLVTMQPEKGFSWQKLFQFHNEHQIVFTKLTVFADYAVLRGDYVLCAIVAVLLACWIPLVYCRSFRFLDENHPARRRWLWTAGVLTALYVNGELLWTLTTPILLQHLFVGAFATTAAYAFSMTAPSGTAADDMNRRAWLLFFASSGLAVLAGANGLLILPAGLLVALAFFTDWKAIRRAAPWMLVVTLAGASLVLGAVYYCAYKYTGSPNGREIPWAGLMKFVIFFTGGPFWRESTWPVESHPNPALVFTTCIAFCGLLVWLVASRLRHRETVSRFDLFHVFMIIFVVLTAAAGAWNRADLSAAEGLNKKYPPTSLLAWLAAASLVIGRHPGALFGRRTESVARSLLTTAAAVGFILPGHVREFHVWRHWRDRLQEAAAMTASGVYDEVRLKRLYFDPEIPFRLALEVWRPRGVYFMKELPAPAYQATGVFEIQRSATTMSGSVSRVEPAKPRPDFTGWLIWGEFAADGKKLRGKPMVVVDSGGSVAGYGYVSEETGRDAPIPWFAAWRDVSGDEAKVYVREGRKLWEAASVRLTSYKQDQAPVLLDEILDHRDYSLERFNDVVEPLVKPPVQVDADGHLVLSGWAVDRYAQKPAGGVEVEIDGEVYACVYGWKREDVAQYFHQPAYKNSGFLLKLAAAKLGPGRHELRVRVLSADGKSYRRSAVFRFEVK